MSKSPVEHKLPYVYIIYRDLSSSYKKEENRYYFKPSLIAIYFSLFFLLVGLSIFRPTIEPSFFTLTMGLLMIFAAIFQWFYVKSRGSYFDLKNKKFYQNQGYTYDFDEIKALQLLEYIEDTNIRRIKYQLNLILDGLTMNRIILMEGYTLSFMKKELHTLADIIQKPAFDITEGKPLSRTGILLYILLIISIILTMFYLSVGWMFFH